MSIKSKIVSIIFVGCIATIFMVGNINKAEANIENNKYSFDKVTAKKNAKDFVDSIELVEKSEKLNSEFYIEHEKRIPLYNLFTIVMENDDVKVEIDNKGEPIVFMNKLKTSQEKLLRTNKKIAKEELQNKAEKMANKFEKDKKVFISNEEMANGYMSYKWARTYSGYKYDLDFVLVTLDPYTGEIALSSKMFVSNEPEIDIRLNENSAQIIAVDTVNKIVGCKVEEIKAIDTVIVNPNYRWTENATHDLIKDTRLAFTFTFNMIEPYMGELTVWIDAENGNFLGGTNTK